MSKEQNIAAVKRWGSEVANQGKLEVLDDILAPTFVDHDPAPDQGPGAEGLKDFFRTFRSAFPDLSTKVEAIVATDDEVAMRYTVRGTHQGDFMGVPPTGRRFEAAALQIAKFKDGKCIERWGSTDELGILKQLGIVDQVH